MNNEPLGVLNKPKDGVAYIVVSWNNQTIIGDCLKSIQLQDYKNKKKVLVIDNSSSDKTLEYLKDSFPEVEVLAQSENLGFAKGNNLGIVKALEDPDIEYVVLLNTDARLDKNWTTTLVESSKLRPLTATMQSITLDYYDPSIIDSTHIYISRNGQGTQGSWRQPIATKADVPPQKVFGCNAAAMLITRKFIEAQPFKNFLDQTMFMYLEDVDVAARASVMGWDNFVIPGTRAYHMGSVSSAKKDPSFSIYMTFRNNTGLLIKNLPAAILVRILVSLPKADRAAIKHLKRIGKPQAIPALIKGRVVSIGFIPIFLWKRHQLKNYRKVNKYYLWQLMRRGY
ncbi:MAG TPA: glycosyltransferase family 2 protein [Candidatus Saccharimonadales bacterium]|nr:glycosyltransferase family 2 protein [Candidatus Saccharimonadales bacterium]